MEGRKIAQEILNRTIRLLGPNFLLSQRPATTQPQGDHSTGNRPASLLRAAYSRAKSSGQLHHQFRSQSTVSRTRASHRLCAIVALEKQVLRPFDLIGAHTSGYGTTTPGFNSRPKPGRNAV